ncbi:phenylalanine--tRNA ligase subunit beta [Acidianus sulfidivorans JP7]|uniref:phenylalanine--tRNA ligase n=1 Tax=Acidianus sulfidivorans JP7 TaxID=619593 RepID=A0A2U9IM64_9CREN|nr:phenylalanine--tRNA ligase subunit beta [Acidianus sulfidivorans]AWR97100.1 phenylalanine--tRNA ligase subunit beta [Acidianus sulfidivorans JP7]
MVTINLKESRLMNLLKINEKELEEVLFNLKSEIEKIGEDEISVEINADRLDMLSPEGIKRAVDGLLGRSLGEAKYEVINSDYTLIVEDVKSRPYALGAVIYDIKIDEDRLKEIIQFQEKLHDTIGRKRKKVAIGIHDLDKIDQKIIKYKEVPLDTEFIPLHSSKKMKISEVISNTEQGKMYGSISINNGFSPAIVQDDNEILSIPPIINSDKTTLDVNTRNLFIDVTGTNLDAVAQTLDLLVSNFAEGGSKIGLIRVESSYTNSSPLLIHNKISVTPSQINSRLGLSLSEKDIETYILKMRMDAKADKDKIDIVIPQYRVDILTYADISEDVAMAYGYGNFKLNEVRIAQTGSLLYITRIERAFRELAVGSGFEEIFNLVLTNNEYLYGDYAKIENPISMEYNAVRNSLIWPMLSFLSKNQHARFPIKVFEVGEVVVRDENSDSGYSNSNRACLAIMDSKISYEYLQAIVHQIIYNLTGKTPKYVRQDKEYYIKGRSSKLIIDDKELGEIGEVSPEYLTKFNIKYPIVISELYLDKIGEL